MRYCFLPMLACRRASTGSVLSHTRYKASPITSNATSEKMARIFKNTLRLFMLLNCFSLAKIILVRILNSPVHSNNNMILCVLCASLAYKEQAIRVPVMMKNRVCDKYNFTTNFKNDGKVQMTSS